MAGIQLVDGTSLTAAQVDIHDGWVTAFDEKIEQWRYIPTERIDLINATEDEKGEAVVFTAE